MAVTRSKAVERAEIRRTSVGGRGWRLQELGALLAVGVVILIGFFLVLRAKAPDLEQTEQGLAAKKLLDLNQLNSREDLLPFLANVTTCFSVPAASSQVKACPQADRTDEAAKIFALGGGLSNVGRIRGLMNGDQFRELKPLLVVRHPAQFRGSFLLWATLFLFSFLLVHGWWSIRGFRADQLLLPAVLLLSGIGLTLMVSLRDPVRDNLLFVDFAQGSVFGCLLLAGLSGLNFDRLFGRLSF